VSLLDAARAVVSLDTTVRQFPGDARRAGSTRDKKARGRLSGALLVWEALTGKGVEYAYEVVKEGQPKYGMVYRCQKDDVFGACGWSTTEYADIDEHEDQLDPGHIVVGQMERLP
jgi:hypothetical protein